MNSYQNRFNSVEKTEIQIESKLSAMNTEDMGHDIPTNDLKNKKIYKLLPKNFSKNRKEKQGTKPRSKFTSYLRAALRAAEVCVVIIATGIIVSTFFISVLQVRGNSMEPTLNPGEIIVASHSDDFSRGDLIAFYYNNRLLLKRVIAFPKDEVNIDEDGSVYVNGKQVQETYISKKSLGESDIEFPYEVPENRYFVLGDQREISVDSRSNTIGSIAQEQIVGRLIMRLWPLQSITLFDS